MSVWKLKSCPRCNGDLFIAQDYYGWYQQCLQCAHRSELKDLAEFNKRLVSGTGASCKK